MNLNKCPTCGKKIGFLKLLFINRCDSCYLKEKERSSKERYQRELEYEKLKELNEIKEFLEDCGVIENSKKAVFVPEESSWTISDTFSNQFEKKYSRLYGELPRNARSNEYILDLPYQTILDNFLSRKIKRTKFIEELFEKALYKFEKDKLEAKRKHQKIKQKVEKEIYGKEKLKRKIIPEDLRREIFSKYNYECAVCSNKEGLHIHHKDKNSDNNSEDNLILLCSVCHKKVHMKVR